MRRSLGSALTAAALVGAGLIADRLIIDRWRKNPDPLLGREPSFPDGVQRWVITDDGANINTVTAQPTSNPVGTVVLVHGLTGSLDDWGPVAEQILADGFMVVAVDQRGHGRSVVGSAGYSPAIQGADLAAVLTQLDLSDAMIVGHSMGGMATMTLALDHREIVAERVRCLGLLSTTSTLNSPRSDAALRLGSLSLTDRFTAAKNRLRLGAGLMAFGDEPSLFMVDQGIRSSMSCPDEARRGATAGLIGFDAADRVGAISVPALVIAGSADRIVPPDAARFLASVIPDSDLTILDGAGHMMIWEEWPVLASSIGAFFHRHHRRPSSHQPQN